MMLLTHMNHTSSIGVFLRILNGAGGVRWPRSTNAAINNHKQHIVPYQYQILLVNNYSLLYYAQSINVVGRYTYYRVAPVR